MDITEVTAPKIDLLKQKIKQILGKNVNYDIPRPKLTAQQVTLFKEQFGFELVAIPSFKELELDDAYFDKMYPHKNKFWKDEFKESIQKDHKQYGGKFMLYESVQKPNFLSEIQLYGSEKGEEPGLDKIEKIFIESYELLEAKGDLELMLAAAKNRYSWSYDNLTKYVLQALQREIQKAGLPGKVIIRPATNFIDTMLFPYNGKTETYEWTSTRMAGAKTNLTVGHAPLGGLSCVLDHDTVTYYANIGVRFAILL